MKDELIGLVDTYKLCKRSVRHEDYHTFADAIFSFEHNGKLYKMDYWGYDDSGRSTTFTLSWNQVEILHVEDDNDTFDVEELCVDLKVKCEPEVLAKLIQLMLPFDEGTNLFVMGTL